MKRPTDGQNGGCVGKPWNCKNVQGASKNPGIFKRDDKVVERVRAPCSRSLNYLPPAQRAWRRPNGPLPKESMNGALLSMRCEGGPTTYGVCRDGDPRVAGTCGCLLLEYISETVRSSTIVEVAKVPKAIKASRGF